MTQSKNVSVMMEIIICFEVNTKNSEGREQKYEYDRINKYYLIFFNYVIILIQRGKNV